MEQAELTENITLLFSGGVGMTLYTGEKLRGGKLGPTSSEKKDPLSGSGDVALWGAANNWPQLVVEEIRTSDLLRPLRNKQAKRIMGQGIGYGVMQEDPRTGDWVWKEKRIPAVDRWLRRTNANLYGYEALLDWITHGITFPELQMDYGGKVAAIYNQDATRCRLKKKNEEGRITSCYISGRWPDGAKPGSEHVIELPALDPYYDVAGQVMASKSARFVLPIRLLVDDNDYYGQGVWHGLIEGGYLELARAIIASKLYLAKNLRLIKYHVEVGSEFWPLAFPGWDDMKPEEKRKKKQDTRDAFTKWATDQENTGGTFMSDMLTDNVAVKKEYRSLWKITPLKLDIPTGAWVEDSSEVDAKIIRAFMDASLFGATPSKDRNSSGSGSDKRIAHTIELLDTDIDTQLLLSPFDVASEVNGWNEEHGLLVWKYRSLHSTTRDTTMGMVTPKDANQPKPAKA